MMSKNKPAMTAAERRHVDRVKQMNCIVCGAEGPCDAHEPEQGLWFASMPLCRQCHMAPHGWHGTRDRWKLRKMDELKAIDLTVRQLYGR